jgi:hypothetical protein
MTESPLQGSTTSPAGLAAREPADPTVSRPATAARATTRAHRIER